MNEQGQDIKSCCANFYQSDWVQRLLGPVLHPGGLALTHHLGELLGLSSEERVLDIACGPGATSTYLAQTFGCHVTGVDYGAENIVQARLAAQSAGVEHLTEFYQGDAERLLAEDSSFDMTISECAFCTFPNKAVAAAEMARVLRPDGRLGITDIAVNGTLPEELRTTLAWLACVADARPIGEYVNILEGAGFGSFVIEDHRDALRQMIVDIQGKLLAAELAAKLYKLNLSGLELESGKRLIRLATEMIDQRRITYVVIIANKNTSK
jgi:SAM-dependent methyltransferase